MSSHVCVCVDDPKPVEEDGSAECCPEVLPEQVRVVVSKGGRIVVPVPYRKALGIEEGAAVFMRIEGDELHVVSDKTELRRIREMIAKYVPEGVSLADELIKERRREAAAENKKWTG